MLKLSDEVAGYPTSPAGRPTLPRCGPGAPAAPPAPSVAPTSSAPPPSATPGAKQAAVLDALVDAKLKKPKLNVRNMEIDKLAGVADLMETWLRDRRLAGHAQDQALRAAKPLMSAATASRNALFKGVALRALAGAATGGALYAGAKHLMAPKPESIPMYEE